MKRLLRNSLFCIFGACLLTACNEHTLYHSYQALPSEGWAKGDTLFFQIPLTDSVPTTFRIYTEIRNKSDYPYRDLYLYISQNLQSSTLWKTDTLAVSLVDPTGRWTGNGWGSIYQSDLFFKSVLSSHSGNRTIKITHAMKDGKLIGINDIGIRIERK